MLNNRSFKTRRPRISPANKANSWVEFYEQVEAFTTMLSVTITFELQFKSILETTSVLAIFIVSAILLVTWRYRRFLKPRRNGRLTMLDRVRDRRPVPEENVDNQWNEVKEIYSTPFFSLSFSLSAHCDIFVS